jgi:hypothetical protein
MAIERDRQSIGLTPASQVILEDLTSLGWFGEGQDLARFAMAYAMKQGVGTGAATGTDTRWAIGNFDETAEIRDLVAAVYPDATTPVRLIEHFVNEGLRLIGERVAAGERSPTAFLE